MKKLLGLFAIAMLSFGSFGVSYAVDGGQCDSVDINCSTDDDADIECTVYADVPDGDDVCL